MELNFLFVRRYKADRQIPFHTHQCYEFVYYVDGKGETTCSDKTHSFDTNSYIIIPPNTVHNEIHIGTGHIIAIGFSIDDDSLKLEGKMHHGFNPNIYALIQKIKTEFIKKDIYYQQSIRLMLNELTINLKREQTKKPPSVVVKQSQIDYVVSYLNEYFMMDIDLKDLAYSTGYSLDHFRKLFKKQTNQSPKSFIMSKRITYAKLLLKDQAIPLTTVAVKCGYEYYTCFSAFFKLKTGYTPLQFRRLHS